MDRPIEEVFCPRTFQTNPESWKDLLVRTGTCSEEEAEAHLKEAIERRDEDDSEY